MLLLLGGCASGGRKPGTVPLNRNPSLYAFTLQNEGSGFFQQGRYQEALERFKKAESIQPGNATVHNMIGLCYMRLDQLDQALASFSQALSLAPAFTNARNNRGAVYMALEQYQLAEVDFAAVLGDSTYPHRWQAFFNLGMVYLQRGQLGAAEENLRRAATAPLPVFDAFLRLADIARELGKQREAESWLMEARLKFPERVEASLQLGMLLAELGREDEARRYLEEVISSDASSELAEQARTLLTALGNG
jgi:type IV pilus biogenesis/stability protein PilW